MSRKEKIKAHSHDTYEIRQRKKKDWQIIRIIAGQLKSMYLICMGID
jgi:hypothetical protein